MRALILACLTFLTLSTGSLMARNGETGILIVIRKFEIQTDAKQQRVFVICEEDLQRLQTIMDEGYGARIYLQGYGVYDVQEDAQGSLRIHQVATSNEETFSLMSHECHATSGENGDSPSC